MAARDLRENNLDISRQNFGSDLDGTIKKHPRHSTAMLRVFRLRPVQRWPEDWRDMSKLFSLRSSDPGPSEDPAGHGHYNVPPCPCKVLSLQCFSFLDIHFFLHLVSTFPLIYAQLEISPQSSTTPKNVELTLPRLLYVCLKNLN